MATQSKSKSTRNRRTSAKSTGTQAKGKASVKKTEPTPKAPQNQPKAQRRSMDEKVVQRRLDIVPDDKSRAEAAKRFAQGESIKSLAEEFELSVTRAVYCFTQELVSNQGESTIDKNDPEAIKATYQDENIVWAACRAGVSGNKVAAIVND